MPDTSYRNPPTEPIETDPSASRMDVDEDELIRLRYLPSPDLSKLEYRQVFKFSENDAQGVAFTDEHTCVLSSMARLLQYRIAGPDMYRPSSIQRTREAHLSELLAQTDLSPSDYDHIGALGYADGLLFAPLRCTRSAGRHVVLALTVDLEVVAYGFLARDSKDAFATINPWTGLLYTADREHSDRFHAYDVSRLYQRRIVPRTNWGRRASMPIVRTKTRLLFHDGANLDPCGGVQGVAFSPNARMYVARYDGSGPWDNSLRVYNGLTGVRTAEPRKLEFPSWWDEIEGLWVHPSGVIYVTVADNNWPGTDEFQVYAFRYTDPDTPV